MKRLFIVLYLALLLPAVATSASWKTQVTEQSTIDAGDIFFIENAAASANNWLSVTVLTAYFNTNLTFGDTAKVGTPVNNQVGIWTGDGTLEGDADFTFDGTDLTLTGDIEANEYFSSAADGARRSVYQENTTYTPAAGEESIYNIAGDLRMAEGGSEVGSILSTGADLTGADLDTSVLSSTQTLAAGGCKGQHYYITGLYTITLPAVNDGDWCCFQTVGANIGTIDPNVSDLITLNGTALTDGTAIVSDGTTGQEVCLSYYDATGFITWGGAAWVSE